MTTKTFKATTAALSALCLPFAAQAASPVTLENCGVQLSFGKPVESDEEWPVVSWETIARANPSVIVLARMDRRRFEADDVEKKLAFLKSDPVASQMEAVKNDRIVVIDAHAMDPSIRNITALETLAEALPAFGLK